jgi:Pyridoxamine 5'-phosphate oxidase
MVSWQEFAEHEPALAEHGLRMFLLNKGAGYAGGLAYLATVRKDGGPRVHPISPVLVDGRLYAFVLHRSPKKHDLLNEPRYALHSFPHPLQPVSFNDEEFYISRRAVQEDDPHIRQAVAAGCGDPVESGMGFELLIERLLHKSRAIPGRLYTTWRAS